MWRIALPLKSEPLVLAYSRGSQSAWHSSLHSQLGVFLVRRWGARLEPALALRRGLSYGCGRVITLPPQYGPRLPMLVAAALQLLNFLIITCVMPESLPKVNRRKALDMREANPLALLKGLLTKGALLRGMAIAWFFLSLARCALDEFVNYTALRFGWTQEQAGPVMVLVGTSVAIAPRVLVPLLGLRSAIVTGLTIFAVGLASVALAPTASSFMCAILVVSVGTVCMPGLQAFITNMAKPEDRGVRKLMPGSDRYWATPAFSRADVIAADVCDCLCV